MASRADEIRTRQAEIRNDLDALETQLAGDDLASDTLEELQTRSDVLLSEFDDLSKELKPLAERENRIAQVRSAMAEERNRTSGFGAPDVHIRTDADPFADMDSVRAGLVRPGELRGRAKCVIERFSKRHDQWGMDNESAHAATRLVEKLDGSMARQVVETCTPEYLEHFRQYMSNPVGYAQRAAMALSPSSAGGYLVPTPIDPTIILTNAGAVNPVRQYARVEQITAATQGFVTSAGVNVGYLAEATAATDGSPTVGPLTLTPKKLAAWVSASFELYEDSNIGAQIMGLFADAKARKESDEFATGAGGANAITGLVTAGTVLAPTGSLARFTGATPNGADVYALQAALPQRFRGPGSRPVWLGSNAALNQLRQMPVSTGVTTTPLWQSGNLLGAPVLEQSSIAYAAVTGTKVLIYGDLSQYIIADRIGFSVAFNPNQVTTAGAPLGQVGWFGFWRTDANVATATAIRVLSVTT